MKDNRRDFVKQSAIAAVTLVAGCTSRSESTWSDPDLDKSALAWHKSVCRFCGTGCGVQLGMKGEKLVALRGDADHPGTRGLVCAKALFLPKIVYAPDRLTKPQIRKNGELVDATWDEAMQVVAERFADDILNHGPQTVSYYGSGQCLSEESYLANRLFKGGIGCNNVEGNPRLCMASAVGGYVTTFGKDEPMGSYDDIDHARVFFLVGSNTAESHPVIFDRILMNRQKGARAKVIVVDPRKTPVRSAADIHLAPIAGYDLALFHAMAQVIISQGLHKPEFIDAHATFQKVVDGESVEVTFDEYQKFLEDFTPEKAAEICGVPAADIVSAAKLFASGPTVSFWTMGLNQRTTGVWANNLVHNLHLLTGQIGKPGATPFSLTGQPNACGGVRDTGSLCHILPYGRLVTNAEHRAQMESIWGCDAGKIPAQPGLNTIELFKALGRNEVRSMLILTTNPGQSLPNLESYRDAMGKPRDDKPFVVVVDAFPTRTTELADVVLPAAMWSEKEGVFGMSERRYQFLPKIIAAPGEARSDFDILLDLAGRLEQAGAIPAGFISSKFKSPEDVWNEMRAASAGTAYDFTGMTRERLKQERGLRWPCPSEDHPGTARRFVKGEDPMLDSGPYADESIATGDISFYGRPDKKAVIWLRPAKPPAEPVDDEYPFILSTGRVLEHWHTGTMTMRADELRRAQPACYVEIHPDDAEATGIASGDMVKITSRRGEAT
ncbi:MAG: nitrate reductase, partial [Planctomycetales bacterium]|nr:nitrate reductase [Planctomycetales bacterium]